MVETCATCGRRVRWRRLIDLHRHAEAHDVARSMGADRAIISYAQWIAALRSHETSQRDPDPESGGEG